MVDFCHKGTFHTHQKFN